MSEMIDQADGLSGVDGSAATAAEPTPIGEILDNGAADGPASGRERDDGADAIERFDREMRTVPLAALHKEKERRKAMDKRVQELQDQLNKYEDAKYGLYDDEPAGDQNGNSERAQERDPESFVHDYNQSYTKFATKHGREYTATVDAALRHLTPGQTDEMMAVANKATDPVEAVHGYIKKLGLLEHKTQSIADVLAGKEREKQADGFVDKRIDPQTEMARREQEIAAAEGRVRAMAMRTEFVAEHGKAAYDELDAACHQFTASGHPAVAEFVATCRAHPDPIGAAAYLLTQMGVWSPTPAAAPQQRQPRSIFPSNLAAARNVGVRNGPAYAGPTPLKDIFDRRNREAS